MPLRQLVSFEVLCERQEEYGRICWALLYGRRFARHRYRTVVQDAARLVGAEQLIDRAFMESVCRQARRGGLDYALTTVAFYQLYWTAFRVLEEHRRTRRHLLPGFRLDMPAALSSEDYLSLREIVGQLLRILDARSRLVVERYFGLDGLPEQTLSQIAVIIKVGRGRTHQILKKALRLLQWHDHARKIFERNREELLPYLSHGWLESPAIELELSDP